VAILRDLQSRLENRLSVKESVLWSFKLGSVLGKIKAEIDSDEKTQANISELNQLSANAPPSISEASRTKIRETIESVQQAATDSERKEKLLLMVENLKNARIY
jgi:hypothetical protein